MKLHRFISYSLMTVGAAVAAKAMTKRWRWDEANIFVAIMLDWDDVLAVATRASQTGDEEQSPNDLPALLKRFREHGATHLSIPELTLHRLLKTGELSVTQGSNADLVYLRAQNSTIGSLVSTELAARLPHLSVKCSKAQNPLISFCGDLPAVAEVGLGFNPAHAKLAQEAGLFPVPRPIGYSWQQPGMIERTMSQAAALGAKVVAVQGNLMPGHEFNLPTTIQALQNNHLSCAFFSESRHQRGDWHLIKNLSEDGLVIRAHEFEPSELLDEDWNTISQRWANLALEAGIRLCSIRFFRVLHAADPLEALLYIRTLARTLRESGLVVGQAEMVDMQAVQPERDATALAAAGLSAAGAAGLASDLLPLPDMLKLLGVGGAALTLASLPFLEQSSASNGHDHQDHDHHDHHHHDHDHDHDHGHHHDHDHDHDHDHHDHHHHHHDRIWSTAYAPKGIALATTVAYPAAAAALSNTNPLLALTHALTVSAAGTSALSATTVETDYLMGIETYRAYNLDWLLPLGLTAATALLKKENGPSFGVRAWLPLAGIALAALGSLSRGPNYDNLAAIDREHRHAHTHHLSAFQRVLGDSSMALSLKPLRKWSLLAPLGAMCAAILKRRGNDDMAAVALTAAAAGQVAMLTGVRNGQRHLVKTLEGRSKGWVIGTGLGLLIWLIARLMGRQSA